MIVADTNLLAYLFLGGPDRQHARTVLRMDSEWHAPYLWRSEFRNVLATVMRTRGLALVEAVAVAREAEAFMGNGEHAVGSVDVLRLASLSGRSAYDCEFVVLAQALEVPLVTSDGALREAFPEVAVAPEEFGG